MTVHGTRKETKMKLISLLAVLVAALGLAGGAPAAADAVVTGAFAGKAQGGAIGVAVLAEKPAADGQARTVSVYICNGSSLAVWLTGLTAGNTADLKSADGRYGVHVELAPLTASGKVGLAGGSGFSFTVPRALGVAGLYDVAVAANGIVRGRSVAGGSLAGKASAKALSERGSLVANVTAGGRSVKLAAPTRHLTPGAYRWIVLADGSVWGASTLGPIRGGIGGLVRPTGGRHARIKAGGAGQKGYDDRKCGQLAGQFNQLNAKYEAGIVAGKETAQTKAAGKAAQKILDELDDHCLVIQ